MSRNAAQTGVAAHELLAVARTSQPNASIVRRTEHRSALFSWKASSLIDDHVIRGWRLAHDTLTVGPILALAIAAVLSSLSVGGPMKSWLAWAWVVSNYGFCFSLPLAAMVGQRGRTLDKPLSNQLVFVGNMIGLGASSVGTAVLLYAAYVSLP